MTSQYPQLSTLRLVTKANTASADTLPFTGTADPTLASAAWAQVVASSAVEYYVTGVAYYSLANSTTAGVVLRFEVGIGGSGSEVGIGTTAFPTSRVPGATSYPAAVGYFQVPIRISAGTRISGRFEWIGGSYSAYLLVVPYLSVEGN